MEKMSALPDRCDQFTGLTLDAILANEKTSTSSPAPTRRTLLDIIRNEDPDSKIFCHNKDGKRWKLFGDGLRIKRAAAAWTSLAGELRTHLKDSVSTKNRGPRPQFTRRSSSLNIVSSSKCSSSCGCGVGSRHVSSSSSSSSSSPSSTPQFSRHDSIRVVNVARERTRHLAAVVALAQADQAEAPMTSLMELLEETDRQMSEKEYILSDDEEEEEEEEYEDCEEEEEEEEEYEECGEDEEEVEEENGEGEMEKKCCVCMARHRGAAFIPCGHTFCRVCSRELWAKRGNCPLCNASISEILHIF